MILAIDTATDWVGLALHDGGAVLAEFGWRNHRTQTIELAPAVAQLWARTGTSPDELSAIAIAIGPGSYTGLRVSLSLCKGIALGLKLPLIGVPTLDIVAATVPAAESDLIVVAQAGRTRLWSGHYVRRPRHGWQAVGDPVITQWDDLLAQIQTPVIFAGEIDAVAARQIRRTNRQVVVVSPATSVRRAAVLAEIGWTRLKKQQVVDAEALAPLYYRDPA